MKPAMWLRPPDMRRTWYISRLKEIVVAALVFLLAGIPAARAQNPAPAIRTEVPIRQLTLSDGTIRYWIPVKVGGKSVDALLDTGTTGLRMLPGVISGALTTKGPSDRISFWSGTEFSGEVARSTISLGGISGLSEFQSIKKVECARGRPSCPAKHASLDNYGIGALHFLILGLATEVTPRVRWL